jgi:hypothetical protein
LPAAQSGHDPPQSTSLSLPFLTLSVHVSAWQTLPVQTSLTQSVAAPHAFPGPQGVQLCPPQSTSLSVPFFTLSVQLASWQTLPVQM